MTAEILIGDVLIMSRLMPRSASVLNIMRRDAGVGAHAGADDAHLGDVLVAREALGAQLRDDRLQGAVGGGAVLGGDGARDVGVPLFAGVLDDHVDVDVRVGQGAEDLGRHAGPVGHAAHGDPGLVGGVGDGSDDRALHGVIFLSHPGAVVVGEARAHVDGDVVLARVLDGAHGEDLRAGGGHLEHLVVGDVVDLARLGDQARVGGVDAVDVRVDLADVGVQGVGQGHGGGVGAAAAERRDVLLGGDALEAGDEHDLALVHGLLHAGRA